MATIVNTNERTIRLILEITREADDSFSIGLEDEHFEEDSDERYVGGISEGQYWDPAGVAKDAGQLVSDYLGRGQYQHAVGAIHRIAVPMEFKPSGE
ncbi:hypothetical protein [uncultured Microbacterium sp.]|uniref:hypothetical protein n=1 Tax=uncultured Microbacterium sp. TaxID=191216 RepID=UPI0025FBEB96|nr:hypothetical protein [uncultured Microbacterium sp.]